MTTSENIKLRIGTKVPGIHHARVDRCQEGINEVNRLVDSSARLAVHTYVTTEKLKGGIRYEVHRWASDTGNLLALDVFTVQGGKIEAVHKGGYDGGDREPGSFAALSGKPGWTIYEAPKQGPAVMSSMDVSSAQKARKSKRNPGAQPLKLDVKEAERQERQAKRKPRPTKKAPVKAEGKASTPVVNEVKIYPAHRATLAAVFSRGTNQTFNLAEVMAMHEEDGYEIAKAWCRRTLLELTKAGLFTRTPERGRYTISKQGITYAKKRAKAAA